MKRIRTRYRKGSGGGKSKYIKVKGIASYAQIYRPDEFRGASNWKINLHPDAENIQLIKDAGIQLTLKDRAVDNADGKFFTFKRPVEKNFGDSTTFFAPPAVYDKDGKPIVEYYQDGRVVTSSRESDEFDRKGEPVLIGNGSLVELTIEVYPTKAFGHGNRLVDVKILDLVEYEEADPDEDEDDNDGKPPFDVDDEDEEEKPKQRKSASSSGSSSKARRKVDW